jgi:hypothetical protein
MENVRFTTPIQQLYNNLSHESRSYILENFLIYNLIDLDALQFQRNFRFSNYVNSSPFFYIERSKKGYLLKI